MRPGNGGRNGVEMSLQGGDGDNGRIVELNGAGGVRPAPAAVMSRVESYWERKRADRLVPSRAEIDPRGLEGVLAQAFVLERISTGLARFRVAGSHLADLMGLEVRGMPISSVFVPDSREVLSDAIAAVFDDPSVVHLSLSSEGGFGRPALQGEMILLPLRSDLGDISRVLGAVQMSGRPGRAPRRLIVAGQSRRGLTGHGGSAFTIPPRDLSQGRDRRGAHPHLRLVADNTRPGRDG